MSHIGNLAPKTLLANLVFFAAFSASAVVPTAGPQRLVYPDCNASILEDRVLSASDEASQLQATRDFFKECADRLSDRAAKNAFEATIAMGQLAQIEVDESRFIPLELTLADGLKSNALLALQPAPRAYPLVIIKCGALCDVKDKAIRQLYLQLHEEGAAHVLLLPSSTSAEFQLLNGVVMMGGVLEGFQLSELAREIRQGKSPVNDKLPLERLGSVHVLGVSLGGHAALYAGLMSGKAGLVGAAPAITSVMAACSVVDEELALKDLFVTMPALNKQIRDRFHKEYLQNAFAAAAKHEKLKDVLGLIAGTTPTTGEIPGIAARGSLAHFPLVKLLAPLHNVLVQTEQDYWEINRFQNWVGELSVPTVSWSARNDTFFRFENSGALLEKAAAGKPNPHLQLLSTDKGNHCLYSNAFGWDTMSAFLRALVVARSPELKSRRQVQMADVRSLPFPENFRAAAGERRFGFEWEAHKGALSVTLRTQLLTKAECKALLQDCYRSAQVAVPLAVLKLDVPATEAAAASLTRWLNANVRPRMADGKLPRDADLPESLLWSSY